MSKKLSTLAGAVAALAISASSARAEGLEKVSASAGGAIEQAQAALSKSVLEARKDIGALRDGPVYEPQRCGFGARWDNGTCVEDARCDGRKWTDYDWYRFCNGETKTPPAFGVLKAARAEIGAYGDHGPIYEPQRCGFGTRWVNGTCVEDARCDGRKWTDYDYYRYCNGESNTPPASFGAQAVSKPVSFAGRIRGVPYPGGYYSGSIDNPPAVDCPFGFHLGYWGVDQWVCYRDHDKN